MIPNKEDSAVEQNVGGEWTFSTGRRKDGVLFFSPIRNGR